MLQRLRPRAHAPGLWVVILLTTTFILLGPLAAHAKYNISMDEDAPSGEGQPDDIGAAPQQPGLLHRLWHRVTHWSTWAMKLFSWERWS